MKIEQLTKRESEIVELKAWGASCKMIAERLGIAKRTVDTILNKVHSKLKLNCTNQLSAWYFCKKHKVNELLNPLLTIMLILLIGVGEFSKSNEFRRAKMEVAYKIKSKKS